MAINIRNTQIASFSRNGINYGAFKLAHVYHGNIETQVFKNINGKAVPEKTEDGKRVKLEREGLRLTFQYRTTSRTWAGDIEVLDNGALKASGVVTYELTIADKLTTNSKLAKLLTLIGLIEKAPESGLEDDDFTEVDTLSDDDFSDDDSPVASTDGEFETQDIVAILEGHIGRIIKAPFTKTSNGYINLNSDIALWELVETK